MTVEEIDIVVNVVVEKAIREFQKLVPQIKRFMKSVTEQINKPDLKGFAVKIQQTINQGKQKLENFKKSNENNKIAINVTTKEAEKEISQLQKQINSLEEKINARQMKLNIINPQIDKIVDDTRREVTPDGISPNNKSMDTTVNNALSSNKDFTSLNSQAQKLYTEIEMYNKQLDTAKSKMSQLGKHTSQTVTTQNKLGSFFSGFKNKIDQAKSSLGNVKNIFNKMPNIAQNMTTITAKVQNNIKGMGKGLKQGLGNVLKYASALFSLRGIYSMLSSSAQSWLSSQNAQAKQLSANIEYMKYAMGSAFAPVIQYVTNLVYKLMKAIQTVIYSLFKVNIFANASANSYSSMANSANKTAKATKQLAGFDEINNLTSDDDSSSGSGSGNVEPSFDLSNVDTSLKDWYENLDFYELGQNVAKKINNALSNIDWTEIQNGAKTIATNIGNFINGFVDGLDWSLLGSTVGNGINTALTFANTLFTTVNFEKIGNSIATFLNSAIKTTKWDLLGTTIANGINVGIDTAYGFVTKFEWGEFGTAIGTSINNMFKNIKWDKAGQALTEGLKGACKTLTGFFNTFDWKPLVDGLVNFIKNIDVGEISSALFNMLGSACASLVKLGVVIGNYIAQAFTNIGQYFQDKIEECGGNIFKGIQKGITDAVVGIGKWILDNVWIPFINGFKDAFGIHSPSTKMAEMGGYIIDGLVNGIKGIWDKVKSIFINLYNNIKDKFFNIKDKVYTIVNNLRDGVKDKFNAMKDKVYSVVNNLRNGVKDKFNSMKNKVYTIVNNLRNGVKDKFNSIKNKINTIVTNIKNGVANKFQVVKDKAVSIFNNMKTSVSNIFNGIWSTIKKVINSILGGIEKMANGVVKGINRVINSLNNLNFSIPSWVPGGYGGKSFGLNLKTMNEISIPRLATGNVATKETLAIFGEYSNARTNPEITAPQSTIYETMVQALNDSNFNRGNNNSEFKTLIFKFGSYRVAFELEELRRKAQRQNGTATVII